MNSPQRKIRYGITGFGRFAEKAIAPAIRQSHNSTLVAIHNRSVAKAKVAAAALNIPLAFDSVADLAAHPDVDAVFIVSANSAHCEEAILTAEAGKHVLCEKPMAMNVAECERMMEACKRNNVKLMVGHMVRLSPLVKRMKELVQSDALGKLVRAESDFVYDGRLSSRAWLLDRRVAGGGPTFDVGVHCLDTLRFVLDDEVISVKGELEPVPDMNHTESSSQLLLRFSRGTIATIFSSYASPIRESRIELIGTESRISAVDFTVSGRQSQLRIERRNLDGTHDSVVEEFDIPNLYTEEVNLFSDCIINNTGPLLTAENAVKNQHVLDQTMALH
ncbi:MAG: Gfo/Idh/MocA family oxidoreductase [Bacteroidetes bacterium]|nr:Gfo/Idh/MocA family oxidoreductase [Bacteroidota bacterium]MCW5895151.1 Gfo/Idh/MocA family oxidoreductase [Bacteroidota bacterium]